MPVTELAIDSIDPSPMNPRKTFDQAKLQELAEDIATRGVLQNIIVRKKGTGRQERYEIVVGERRFRASKLAAIKTIPASIVEMDDLLALETMIVENAKRVDVDPIEEADGYRQLLDRHKMSVDDIALRVGRSRSAVYARLKLCDLCDAGRKALADGKLTPSTALLVARIPDAKLQKSAVRDVAGTRYPNDDPMSARRAGEHIQRHFMLRLSEAPWKLNDEELLPDAGSCKACPKRTGNQAELFDDVKGSDVCIDPPCFEKKRKAHTRARVVEGRKAGATVLAGAAAKKLIHKPYSHSGPSIRHDAPFIELDATCHDDSKRRTYRALLKPEPGEVTFVTAHGETFELLENKGLKVRLREAGHKFAQPGAQSKSKLEQSWQAQRKASKGKAAVRDECDRRCLEIIYRAEMEAVFPKKWTEEEVKRARFLAMAFGDNLWNSSAVISKVIGLEGKKDLQPKAISKWIRDETRTAGELYGLVCMIAAVDGRLSGWTEPAAIYKFSRKTIETRVRADVKRLKALKAKKAPKKRAKKKAAGAWSNPGKTPAARAANVDYRKKQAAKARKGVKA